MFEKLLQKILKDVIGQFTEEIDSNQLSIGLWSGQIQINQVKLNRNLFKRFGIPIKLFFSRITQLKIQIPWKSFFTSPLVINIDSAFALCNTDTEQISLNQRRMNLINSIKNLINNIGKQIIQKSKSHQKQQNDAGYMHNILLKMFDNLQLNIKNIHFRFQDPDKRFSFGLCIESIQIYAIDQNMNKIFIDRNKMKQNQKLIRRKFKISKFKFYWETNQTKFYINQNDIKRKNQLFLKEIKQNHFQHLRNIFYIDLQGIIIQKILSEITEYDINLFQQIFQIKIKKSTIQQFLLVIKRISELIQIQKKIIIKQNLPSIDTFLKKFIVQYLSSDNKNNSKLKQTTLDQIVKNFQQEINQLTKYQHQELKKKIQKIVLTQINRQLLIKSLAFKQTNVDKIMDTMTLKKIQNQTIKNKKINLVWKIPKIMFSLFHIQLKPELQLEFSIIQINYQIKNKIKNIYFSISSIQLKSKNNFYVLNIHKRKKKAVQLQVKLQKQKQQTSIKLNLQHFNIYHDSLVINKIKQYFTFSTVDNKVKNHALQKIEKIENDLNIKIKQSQKLNKISFECSINGITMNFIQKNYQFYLKSKIINLEYKNFQKISNVKIEQIICDLIKNEKQINILQPFTINISSFCQINRTQVKLSSLNLYLTRQVYLDMLDFINKFSGQKKQQIIKKSNCWGQIYLKSNNWKKTLSAIYGGKLYIWNDKQQYSKTIMRIRKAVQHIQNNMKIIIISDKKQQIQIAFKNQQENKKWKDQLNKIIQFQQKQQKEQKNISQTNNTSIQFTIQKITVFFNIENSKCQIKLNIQNFIYFNNLTTEISLQNLSIIFNNKTLFNNKNSNQKFLKIKLEDNLQNNQIVPSTQVNLNSFIWNFNPVFIIKLQAFLQTPKKEQIIVKKCKQFIDQKDQQKIIYKTIIKFNNSSIFFYNKKAKFDTFLLEFQELQIQILKKYYLCQTKGSFKNVSLIDISNYPQTIYEQKKYIYEKIQPNKLFTFDKQGNVFSFQYISEEQGSHRNSQKKDLIRMNLQNFNFTYYHQLMFRLMDYFFMQLMGPITSPQFYQQFILNLNQRINNEIFTYKDFVKNKQDLLKMKIFKNIQKSSLQFSIFNDHPLFFQICFTNLNLHLISQKNNEGIYITCEEILIQNYITFNQKSQNEEVYKLYTQNFNIQMNQILIFVQQKNQKYNLNAEDFSIKINLKLFNKDMEYCYIYGQKDIFNYSINATIQLEPCNFILKNQIISYFQKFFINNFQFDDGLQFLMIYDFISIPDKTQMNVKLNTQSLFFQFVLQNQSIILETGFLYLKYVKNSKIQDIILQTHMIVLNYKSNQTIQQILTSRKNFGRFAPRQTFFRSLVTSNNIQTNQNQKNSILSLRLYKDKINTEKRISLSIQQIMIIFNQNFLLMIKKISMRKSNIKCMQKSYKDNLQQNILTINYLNICKILTQKIIICYKFPNSHGMMLALLFIGQYNQTQKQKTIYFPHLQGFVTSETQICNINVHEIKKRTIIHPTKIKFCANQRKNDLLIDRVFVKFSVNDIKQIFNLQQDIKSKLDQISKQDMKQSRISLNKTSKSSINLSQNKKQSENIIQKNQDNKIKNYSFGNFQLMIINDLHQSLTPLIYGNLQFTYLQENLTLKTDFYMNFFNARNSFWQPFIQKSTILINFQHVISVNPDKKQNNFINLNISTNLIQNFYKTVTQKQIKSLNIIDIQKLIGKDQINSWVITNQIGQELVIRSEDQKHQLIVQPKQSAKINFLTNHQQNFNQTNLKQKQIYVNIIIGNKLKIRQININQLGLRKITFNYKQKKCSILKNLFVDISKNVRYLTFSSFYQFCNQTNLYIKFYRPNQDKYFVIYPKSTISIPFNINPQELILDQILQIDHSQRSHSLVYNIIEQKNEKQDKLKQDQKLSLRDIQNSNSINFKGMTFRIKNKQQKLVKQVTFKPFYLIKNLLPIDLTIIFIQTNKQSLISQLTLDSIQKQNQKNQQFIYHDINKSSVSFYVDGFQWTNFQRFQNKFILKDYENKQLIIRIQKLNQGQRTCQILFYYPMLLRNMTINNLKINFKNLNKNFNKQIHITKSLILPLRQFIIEIQNQKSEEIYLKNNMQFFIFKGYINRIKSYAKYFVNKFQNKIKQNLSINQFRIYNKYLIKNQTSNEIILRKSPHKIGQIQIIPKHKFVNLLFFQSQNKIYQNQLFSFCLKNQEFQWSSPLNFTIIKQSTFLLHSKHQFNKVKHFKLQVINKLDLGFQIIISQIMSQDKIPYKFINFCNNKQIFIKDNLSLIGPGEQVNFNWEDPFTNDSLIELQIIEKNKDKKNYTLDVDMKQTIIISSKKFNENVAIEVILQMNKRKFIFKDQQIQIQESVSQQKNFQINMPLRISLINNSISPVIHVLDFSTELKLYQKKSGLNNILTLQLNQIQVDNQAKYNAFFPVLLSTQLKFIYITGKNSSLQIQAKQINLKIQQQFIKAITGLKTFFDNLIIIQQKSAKNISFSKSQSFFISKIFLPKITINLQVQTKNFSLQTTINLQKPAIVSFPWKQFPYPIKNIAINVLSHLSISPWAFLTSFKKGIQILLTQNSTSKAFQGFIGNIIGAFSNAMAGVLGIIIGYDVQRVDNFIDGIDQGFNMLKRSIMQIPEFQSSNDIYSIIQGSGKTLINIIFKPIKGVLQMSLKITQGVKKTAKFSFDTKTLQKTRRPIVFYNREEYFLTYNSEQAEYLQNFKQLTLNTLEYFYLIKFFKIDLVLSKQVLLLVLGAQYVVLLNITKRKIIWIIQTNKIKSVQIVDICKLKFVISQDLQGNLNIRQASKKISQNIQNQYQIFLMNQMQANDFIQHYIKIKKKSQIVY